MTRRAPSSRNVIPGGTQVGGETYAPPGNGFGKLARGWGGETKFSARSPNLELDANLCGTRANGGSGRETGSPPAD
jgi:hypothetical protein